MKVSDVQLHFQWQVLNCLIATVKHRNFLTLTFLRGKGTGTDSLPAEAANPPESDSTHTHTHTTLPRSQAHLIPIKGAQSPVMSLNMQMIFP